MGRKRLLLAPKSLLIESFLYLGMEMLQRGKARVAFQAHPQDARASGMRKCSRLRQDELKWPERARGRHGCRFNPFHALLGHLPKESHRDVEQVPPYPLCGLRRGAEPGSQPAEVLAQVLRELHSDEYADLR